MTIIKLGKSFTEDAREKSDLDPNRTFQIIFNIGFLQLLRLQKNWGRWCDNSIYNNYKGTACRALIGLRKFWKSL